VRQLVLQPQHVTELPKPAGCLEPLNRSAVLPRLATVGERSLDCVHGPAIEPCGSGRNGGFVAKPSRN
jgi:hypothetical protein